MTTTPNMDWSIANQAFLVAEFSRLKTILSNEDTKSSHSEIERCRQTLPATSAIDHLTNAFGLSPFERDLILLCAGIEMDESLAQLCGDWQKSPQKPWPTFGMALDIFPDAHWSGLTPLRPLRRWQLVTVEDGSRLVSAKLKIDERVLHFLAGVNYLEPRLHPLLKLIGVPNTLAPSQERIAQDILQSISKFESQPPPIVLSGDDQAGHQDVAATAASQIGRTLYSLHARNIPGTVQEQDIIGMLWGREVALLGTALFIDCDTEKTDHITSFVERLNGLIFVSTSNGLSQLQHGIRHSINKPEPQEQQQLWTQALGTTATRLNGSLDGVAEQFRFSAQHIRQIASKISTSLETSQEPDAHFWEECRAHQHTSLGDLGQCIESSADWDDLILPDQEKSILREILTHVRLRLQVYDEWGFGKKNRRGLGITALFAGESGTGKTMAAEVLANTLNLDLYKIDLSSVISKYIGETEKNLSKIFDAAENSGVILLFDEADALFGKRSEVKDSHDRYANIEVSYLLQRMEAYRGLAILTTNLKSSLDKAFLRRLRFIVQFPFPEAEHRAAIWRHVFPSSISTKELQFDKLSRLTMAGGNIRNIALNAAFLAAESSTPISMKHLAHAASHEASKQEQTLSEAETRGWV